MNFTVLGAGAWGTAMTILLVRLGHKVTLVPRRKLQAKSILENRENKEYLPGFKLLEDIKVSADLKKSLKDAEVVLIACPSVGLRDLCNEVKSVIGEGKTNILAFITLCKGLERESFLPPASVVANILKGERIGVLSGPNFAKEIAEGKPAASTLAVTNEDETIIEIQKALSNRQFRVYRSMDLNGVEYAGCLKNVYAIGAGISDGLELGDNAKASYLTRALNEMVKIGVSLGGKSETFYGLSGFGDLVLTCCGALSRNRAFGVKVAQGYSPNEILKDQKTVVEGYSATKCFFDLLKEKKLQAPILEELYAILYNNRKVHEALAALMERELKAETINET